MKLHYIIHAPFEKIGVIQDWAKGAGITLTGSHTYAGDTLPSADAFDALVVMGGPQSPLEPEKYPYLKNEITLIQQAIQFNKKILGFCLGAQLIAEAYGASTLRSPEKEVGVFPIKLTPAGQADPLFDGFPLEFDVIHWHNDMPGIPDGAELLAYSEGCPHQALRFAPGIYGFQFHMEITSELAKGMVENCPEDLAPSKYTQTSTAFMAENFAKINRQMTLILDRLLAA